ncbi:antibiotic biosynthesis monooxygenase [soil metagenome]
MILSIANYTIAYGNTDRVLALLAEVVTASRAEPGCLSFNTYLKVENEHEVVLIEKFENAAAADAHHATPHFTSIVLEQIVPLLSERTVETYEV